MKGQLDVSNYLVTNQENKILSEGFELAKAG
jgi:hypothetical protein